MRPPSSERALLPNRSLATMWFAMMLSRVPLTAVRVVVMWCGYCTLLLYVFAHLVAVVDLNVLTRSKRPAPTFSKAHRHAHDHL